MEPFIQPLVILIFSLVVGFFFVVTKSFYTPFDPSNQQVIGITITFTSVVFGLLLGFTVSNFWTRYVDLTGLVVEEVNGLKRLVEISKGYSGTQGILGATKDYLENTLDVEIPLLRKGQTSKLNDALFRKIIQQVNLFALQNPNSPIVSTLYENIPERSGMKTLTSTNFGTYLIYIIIIAAILTLIGFWFLRNINFAVQVIIDVGVISIISLSIYLLYELKNPFEGIFQLDTSGFSQLLDELKNM